MSHALSTSSKRNVQSTWKGRVGALLLAMLLAGAFGSIAHAQSPSGETAPNQTYQQRSSGAQSGPAGTGVPDWAESEQPSQPRTSSDVGRAATNDPAMPSNPRRTPIGGLGWLIAAGLGYGTYRLGWNEK